MKRLNAKQLRISKPSEEDLQLIKRHPIYIILDNVLDTYNIGAIFRIAEATACTEMLLCGGTETPPSSRIHKAAVGTEEWVAWRYFPTAVEAINELRKMNKDVWIVAVEQDQRSVNFFEMNKYLKEGVKPNELLPVALIVGHETDGVSKEALDASDIIVEMPMYGVNISMNVMVSTGIMVYKILEIYKLLPDL